MQKRSTLVVLTALTFVFAYYIWEHFSEKKNREQEKLNKVSEKKNRLTMHHPQDGMDKAMAYEFEITKDPALNIVPREKLMIAENYRKQKFAAISSRTQTAIPGINWTERGPNNVGGRTRAIIYDLNDAGNGYKKVFAGSVGGGLWVTSDITAGTPTWTRIDDFMGNLAVSTLAQDPLNTQNIYAGSGEGWYNSDAIRGLGIWKSSDGGATWSQLSSTNNSTFYYTQKIVVTSSGVVLAATRSGGVQRSTNGGATWTKVLGNGAGGGSDDSAADLEIGANGNIYCSVGIFSTDGIYRSTDGGVNWTKIYTSAVDEERIELACAPTDQDKIYALLQATSLTLKKVMSTSNATAATPTWNTLTTPTWCDQGSTSADFTRSQAWYDLIAAVDPADANTVYIGGVDIMKSTNAGSAWSQTTRWSTFGCSGPNIHADNHAIVFKPGSSTEFLAGNDGGIYRTTDAGTNFTTRVTGYNVTQYYACAIHPTATNYFLAGAQDNGTQKFSSAGINATTNASGGDGAFCHIDQDNGNIQISSYVFNNYFVSTNGGASFVQRSFGQTGSFINPTDYDDDANILYGGNDPGSFFRWNDAGSAGLSTADVTVTNFGTASVRHVAVSPLTANRVYFGLSNGSVVRVDNANTATSFTGTVIKTGSGSVSCIAIDEANEDHMLVTYSNYSLTSIYESFNANQASPTWTAVEGNLPDMPVRWAMFDPRNSDWALIATELGIWSTDDLNGVSTDWDPTNTSLANVRVDMLQYRSSDRTIAAATHGRGLFTAVVPVSTTPDISFASGSASATESSTTTNGCRSYTDYSINMIIANAPTGDATITVSISGATATEGIDYEFTTNGNFSSPSNTLVFTNGATVSKTITLRIYDDVEVESAQSFTLTYSISGTTNAQAGSSNQTYTFTINDNDSAPTAAGSGDHTVASYDINSNLTSPFLSTAKRARSQYLISASELTTAGLVGNRQITALAYYVISKGSSQAYNGYTISMGHTTATNLSSGFVSPTFTQVYSANYTVPGSGNWYTISFTTPFTWDGISNIVVQVCWDNGNSSSTAGTNDVVQGTATPLGSGNSATAFRTSTSGGTTGCSLSANSISDARPQFRFTQAIPQSPIETVLNSSKSFYLGPNSDVYLYSSTDGELLARIQNLTSHDYGCTNIEIDRAGTGATQFWNSIPANYLMNKTFRIIPSNNNPSGQYTITLYFSAAEVTGWQTATGQSWANIQLIKIPGQISNVTPSTPEPDGAGTVQVVTPTLGTLGSAYTISYTFNNGFSGFGAGIPGASGTLPIELLSFSGRLQGENAKLEWSTAFEQNSKGFEVEKSLDGIHFRKIGYVAGAGNSHTTKRYAFTDPQRAVEFNYYRLKLVDIDHTFDYSDVVLVKNAFGKQDVYLGGNPVTNNLNIQFAKTPNSKVSVSIVDMKGRKIFEAAYNNFNQTSLQINTANKLASGVYSVKVVTGGNVYNLKAVK